MVVVGERYQRSYSEVVLTGPEAKRYVSGQR